MLQPFAMVNTFYKGFGSVEEGNKWIDDEYYGYFYDDSVDYYYGYRKKEAGNLTTLRDPMGDVIVNTHHEYVSITQVNNGKVKWKRSI